MAKPLSPHCPNCNAAIPLVAGQTLYRCEFCGASIDLGGGQAPKPIYVPTRASTPPAAIFIAGSLVAMVLAVAIGISLSRPAPHSRPLATSVPPPRGQVRPAQPPEPIARWNDNEPFWIADVNGDGVDDVVGPYRSQGPGDEHGYVGAFDGKSLRLLWKTKSLDGASPVLTAVQTDRVVVTPGKTDLEVLDARTGERTAQATLSDVPTRLCPVRGEANKVWVGVQDGANVMLDVHTGAVAAARKPPPGCENPIGAAADISSCWPFQWRTRASNTRCQVTFNSPRLEGFAGDRTYWLEDERVVSGKRAPGTAVPMLAVFGKGQREPRWMHAVSERDGFDVMPFPAEALDVENGQIFAVYQLKTGPAHLVSRKLLDGSLLWDVPVEKEEPGSHPKLVWASHRRVYVPHGSRLDVFDGRNGKWLGEPGER